MVLWHQPATGMGLHGDHDLWKLSKDGTCSDKAIVVPNASAGWGDYLSHGTYCMKNNEYRPAK